MHFSVDSTSAIEESLNINNNSTSNTDIESYPENINL